MIVVKCTESVEGLGDKVNDSLWLVLYKEKDGSIFTWSGTEPYSKMNRLTCYIEYSYWMVPDNH